MKETLKRIEALEVTISNASAEIKKLKDELSEPVFEVGKWYKNKFGELGFNIDGNNGYGFEKCGTWRSDAKFGFYNSYYNWLPATESEVFEALKKEAIKRGFKEGVTLNIDCGGYIGGKLERTANGRLFWNSFTNELYLDSPNKYNGCVIMRDGKWAEIIKDEPFKICGYEVKKEDNNYKIGGKTIYRPDVSHLKYLMNSLDVKTAQLGDYKVTIEEINKLLEL